jgi:hypothetical protein
MEDTQVDFCHCFLEACGRKSLEPLMKYCRNTDQTSLSASCPDAPPCHYPASVLAHLIPIRVKLCSSVADFASSSDSNRSESSPEPQVGYRPSFPSLTSVQSTIEQGGPHLAAPESISPWAAGEHAANDLKVATFVRVSRISSVIRGDTTIPPYRSCKR